MLRIFAWDSTRHIPIDAPAIVNVMNFADAEDRDFAVDQHIQQRFSNLRYTQRARPSSWHGYQAGKEAGHAIPIGGREAVTAGAGRSLSANAHQS